MKYEEEIEIFFLLLHKELDQAMISQVRDMAVGELQNAIDREVYAVDWPTRKYQRKYLDHGLVDPREIETDYDSVTSTLTVKSVRDDWEPTSRAHENRNVAEVVETGQGYDWRTVRPRPFHKPAEEHIIATRAVDAILNKVFQEGLEIWAL